MTSHSAPARDPAPPSSREGLTDFEQIYRTNVAGIAGFFARRGVDPQTVADLTSETFVQAIGSRASYDPRVGPPRPWLFGIARMVYARHCERGARNGDVVERQGARVELSEDDIEELTDRIDMQKDGAALLRRLSGLAELERQAVELVDLDGLTPKEAAASLGISAGVLRVRLFRARTKLRKDNHDPS